MAFIDLSQIPPPDLVEPLDFEAVLAALAADYAARLPDDAEPLLESDPAAKVLEAAAYRETLLRARINRVARGVLLASATGGDLDQLAALYGVARQVVTAADPTTVPPTPAVYEPDDRLRLRTQLAPDGFSTAGPAQGYVFHALSASTAVRDAVFASPGPAQARVTVLSTEADGAVSQALLGAVTAALSADTVRPAGDQLTVQAATVLTYDVGAVLAVEAGPDPGVVRAAARAALDAFVTDSFRIGRTVPLSGIYAALTVPNVLGVALASPTADVAVSDTQAARAATITIT